MSVFWNFKTLNLFTSFFNGIGVHSWGPNASFDTHISISSHAKCVIYVKKAKNAIFDAYAIWLMSYIDIAIWVSKDASGPQECRPMPLNNLWIGLTSWNFKILTFKIFLCIFRNFLCIMKGPSGRPSNWARELKFFLVNPDTQYNGKTLSANQDSIFWFFWTTLDHMQKFRA